MSLYDLVMSYLLREEIVHLFLSFASNYWGNVSTNANQFYQDGIPPI